MSNAREICLDKTVVEGEDCSKIKLVVPDTAEVVVRRDYILDLMKTRSPLTGDKYTTADYDAAKAEPVELTPPASVNWKAPHFVWQVREALSAIVLPGHARPTARAWTPVATGSPRRSTGRCSRRPKSGSSRPRARPTPRVRGRSCAAARSRSVSGTGSWACAATTSTMPRPASSTTGPARSWPMPEARATRPRATSSSSHSSTSCQTAGASQGRRSSRSTTSSGIDDGTLTASTMFMDVVHRTSATTSRPIQADKLERGPVRLAVGAAVLAQHPRDQGHAHHRPRSRLRPDQGHSGLVYPNPAVPVTSMGIGTLEVHPDRPARGVRYGRQRWRA